MEKRKIAKVIEKHPYFEAVVPVPKTEQDDGTRDMGKLYPFLISGGTNTERFYSILHISTTKRTIDSTSDQNTLVTSQVIQKLSQKE